ncbi:MAG: primosomal protein N' [Elusimicrobiota bacterium]
MVLEVALPVNIYRNFDYLADSELKIGCRVVVPFSKKKVAGFVIANKKETNQPLKRIIKSIDKEPLINDELFTLAKWISEYYLCPLGVALNLILPSSTKLPSKKEILQYRRASHGSDIIHTAEQELAIHKITGAIEIAKPKTFLLFGQNDSGKTEVYIQAIEWCLKKKYSAIYLVPDVSLTSQFKELLRDRFGESLGVWHSRLKQREKNNFLIRLFNGSTRVILGTRSAVFLPVRNLKLIILDEEDDEFYKNIQTPKYNTKDVAIQRAKITNAVVVLGSATPSIETYYKTKVGQERTETSLKMEVLTLSGRIDNRPLPKISVVNLKYAKKFVITKPLKYAISNALLQKKQVFLLVHRRGWATVIKCIRCGNIIKCPKCNILLVAHKEPEQLLCHYCGYKQGFVKHCPLCNSDMLYSGYGTEKIEAIVNKLFHPNPVLRIDADAELTYSKMFKMMKSGQPCILVGTKIAAKGFDFQNLTVAGIINANAGLYSPDFRSAEKTFSLLTHSIGRCGRGVSPGQVIVQSDNPDHYAVKYAVEFNYEAFYEHETNFRNEFLWPPFTKLINITIFGKDEQKVISESEWIVQKLNDIKNITVLGPVPKFVSYLAGKHRWQILLKIAEQNLSETKQNLLKIIETHPKKNINIVFDIDPLETV